MVSEVQQHLPLAKDILLQEAPLKALDTKIGGWVEGREKSIVFKHVIYLNKYIFNHKIIYSYTQAHTKPVIFFKR